MNLKFSSAILFLLLMFNVNAQVSHSTNKNKPDNEIKIDTVGHLKYTEAYNLEITGKIHQEENYNRLPEKFQKIVSPKVWGLSKFPSGISVRFTTNSPIITVYWKLNSSSGPPAMNRVGASGVDLYCLVNGNWQYVNSALPAGNINTKVLISDMDTSYKTFLLNLPLHDVVLNIQVGINEKYSISSPLEDNDKIKKPIVFYGTSITQGVGASRPGMAYPSIISRNIKAEVINLGFSGNGRFESSAGQILCDIDAELYVLDCTPNSSPDIIKKNTLKLIQQIRATKPETPILLVESIIRENSYFKLTDELTHGGLKYVQAQNKELSRSFKAAEDLGIINLYYLESKDLIGSDHEATIDGTHLSDLGQYRIAEAIGAEITKILNPKKKHRRK